MKQIRAIVIAALLGIQTTYAYTPTTDDATQLQELITAIEEIIDEDKPVEYSFIRQLNALSNQYNKDDKVNFLLETLHGYFVKELNQEKTQTTDDVRDTYQVLVDDYASELTNDDELDDACTDYIDELDILAYVHDISLPVLIGTRYRESHCGYYLPANGRGPMQITSHDYGTGAIDDHEDFITIMEDYIDFTNAKYDRYNRVTDSGEPITLDYTHISYDDIIKHGALYNGLSGSTIYGDIAPANPHYVFDNYDYTDDSDDDYKASRDGLLPITIKTAKWWLENR